MIILPSPRIPALTWLSAGQLDGMNDAVLTAWLNSGKVATLRSLDLDSSDNITEDMLGKFLDRVGGQLEGLALSGQWQRAAKNSNCVFRNGSCDRQLVERIPF